MACTTILVGKNASYDGSTIIARNDDSPSGIFTEKKLKIIDDNKNGDVYISKISKVKIELPKESFKYSLMPSVDEKDGIWGACGINKFNVGMSATETITSNPLVKGADPLVETGIGEEDLVVLVLPYIKTAREGVIRLGNLLKEYGTYESNGIAFNDGNEIWWLETIGGHHFIARKVPDDYYVVMPNQFGLDNFDFEDAYGAKKEHIASDDLKEFIEENHLDLNIDNSFNPRLAFGSHSDSDHVYNTPRAWYMLRYFNPRSYKWDGENADFTPESDDLPWMMKPERKITIEDVKYILGSYYQGTPYNPYSKEGKSKYRPIGISRTSFLGIVQINQEGVYPAIEWISFGSNAFNASIPFVFGGEKVPQYYSNTTLDFSSDNFYWMSRLVAVLGDAHFKKNAIFIERYQNKVFNESYRILNLHKKDTKLDIDLLNQELADMLKKETIDVINKLIYSSSMEMKNGFSRSDN